ncbi:MAG: Rrf2 family transcriptional regulator [Gemmataceae bacterium]
MKLSRTACYAIHAVVHMAGQGDQVVIGHKAAKTLGIPEGFLLRILVSLSRARVLWSIKGPNGGYRLARPAREISVLDIVEAVEGPVRGSILFTANDDAKGVDRKLQSICEEVSDVIRKHLQRVRVSDLVAKRKR